MTSLPIIASSCTDNNVNDYSISINPDNIMLIHHRCHNLIYQRFEGFKQKV